MFKDIIVNLSVRKSSKCAGDYAVSVAGLLKAHITGVAFAYIPNIPGASLGYLPIETIEMQQRDNEAAAQTAVDRFAGTASDAGVNAEPRLLPSNLADAPDRFGTLARCFDLAIVGQVEPETNSIEGTIAESALFASGRPIIVVPYIQKAPIKLDRVMVCWDGSRAATRAIADSMPLLERASNVEVVTVGNERGKRNKIGGSDMGLHLARNGLQVDVTQVPRGDLDAADALLSHAADSGADFIVMGGYGHSRLREFVLGGVTRSILQSMTVPTLMSH